MTGINILDEISHRRFNPLRGSWVMVSPHRTKRPWLGQQESPSKSTLPEYDPQCFLCPGNKRASGEKSPSYQSTYVFANDFPAVKEEQPEYTPANDGDEAGDAKAGFLFQAQAVKGKCSVICFSPKHNLTLADMAPKDIVSVIQTWTSIYRAHLPPAPSPYSFITPPKDQYTYMQIFENKGAAMGCSNPHPHGQIWTTTSLPEEVSLEIINMKAYESKHGSCLLCDYVQLELVKGERIVFGNKNWLALVPYWAVWPYEVLLISKRCIGCLPEMNEEEERGLAEAISQVTKRYDNLFETSFPYSMGIHQTPLYSDDLEDLQNCHIHVHFYPPLLRSATVRKFLVGYEMLCEPQRDLTPEQAATRLRALNGINLYREALN